MTLLHLWTFTYSNILLCLSLSPPLVSCPSDSLSELETDIKVFKDSLLKILDEDEIIEELCLTKWTDPRVLYVTHALTYTYINAQSSSLERSFQVPVSGCSIRCDPQGVEDCFPFE